MLNGSMVSASTPDPYNEAIARIAAQTLDLGNLFGYGEKLKQLGRTGQVCDLYKTWIAYNPVHPLLHAAYFNYAVSLADVPDQLGAINALREAIRVTPEFYPPYINLGGALERMGQPNQAVEVWTGLINKMSAITGDAVNYKTQALKQLGRILEINHNDGAAEDVLKQSLDINPDQSDVIQHWIALRLRQCKWPALVEAAPLTRARLASNISPLSIACYADDPLFQLATAYRYNKATIGVPPNPRATRIGVTPETRRPGRLRIGYVSSDLREHAVGFSLTEVMELHDREAFEIFAYYCGVPSTDATNARLKAGVDHWLDINGLTDAQTAQRVKDDAIDILIDVNGYTKDARTKVFAMRPAPIAVNWFGFPGTMGSSYHHYLIADAAIIPPGMEIYYSEKVLRLDCYQPNDRKRIVAARRPTREEAGLPPEAFVYCALNGMQKLTARTFHRWMTILHNVPSSVLWILAGTDDTNERLRQTAAQWGIARERLIFAQTKHNPDHLARYPLADLFLDAMPYGAHTTAADALWMGVPIMTFPGRSFASRVCASLLGAAGLGDFVCANGDDYVARAVAFGQDPTRLAPFKQRLIEGRDSCLLFDTPRLVRDLEQLYTGMWQDFARGALPVPDLSNLDIYHEIGIGFELENMETLSDEAYVSLYREGLADLDSVYPIRPDHRLWPADRLVPITLQA